ncbi:MAG: hypothetical protein FOGNACKC_06450 [Anaerolineae bacterium]|nr:hypothetical protein [Anaerolineae bacterium]
MFCLSTFRFKSLLLLLALGFALAATVLVFLLSAAATATGSSPELAISITAGQNTGILGPGQRRWFRLLPDPAGERYQPLMLNMAFATGDGHPRPGVNFELFTAGEISTWQAGGVASPTNFGAGMPVSRDGVASASERIWRGTLLRDGDYYLALENNSDTKIDYWLTNAEVAAPQPAPPAAIEPASVPAPPPVEPGRSPQGALPLAAERQTGRLAPGQEVWYGFAQDKTPAQFEEASLTLVMTPDDGQQVQNVTMDIFTAAAVQTWSPNNDAALVNLGAGGVVHRDDNPLTGERFWTGWVVNNDLYYVRLRNGANEPVDYWLFNGDVYRPELGP